MILLGLKVLAFSVEEVDSAPPFIYFFSIPQTFTGAMIEKTKTKGLHVFTETELFYTGILW